MSKKMLQFDDKALKSILKGVKTLAKAVIATLGPKGRNVTIKKEFGTPLCTKDGVTVAKEIFLKDKFENVGAQVVKEAASKTADVAGDGTTTAIVLAEAILTEGVKSVSAGYNSMSIKRGIEKGVAKVIDALEKTAKTIKTHQELKQIATISANNDEAIGTIISDAMEKVGKDGVISIAEAKGIETTLEVVEGMQLDNGYLSPYFITNAEKMSIELENAQILITDKKISSQKELVPILEKIFAEGGNAKPLLIIAEDVTSDALTTLVVNKLKGGLPLCAVKASGFGDRRKAELQDLAILTGGTVISDEVGLTLEDADIVNLGNAKTIKVTKDNTVIVGGKGDEDEIKKRILQIKHEIAKSTSDFDKEKLEGRLAKLAGGVAIINVGAATETEMKEKKDRVEDALHACRAAALAGVVVGGGVALIRASKALDNLKVVGDEKIGVEILKKALFAPLIAIAENCGRDGRSVAEKVLENEENFGYNGLTDQFTDLMKDGVLDPLLVTKSALINASSIASLLVTTASIVTDMPEKEKSAPLPPQMGGDMMGGMGMGGMGMGMPGMDMM